MRVGHSHYKSPWCIIIPNFFDDLIIDRAMFLLPIKINNRIDYMVDFESTRTVVDSFIINSDNGGELFRFYKNTENVAGKEKLSNQILCQREDGEQTLYLKDIKEEQSDSELRIVLFFEMQFDNKSKEQLPSYKSNILSLSFVKDKELMSFDHKKQTNVKKVLFEFKVLGDATESISQLIFFLAPSGQIRVAVLDFGSEATQLNFSKYSSSADINDRFDTLDSFIRRVDFGDIDHPDPCSFLQADLSQNGYDPHLFKSVYFIKKEIEEEIDDQMILPEISGNKERMENTESLFRMLTSKEDLEEIKRSHIQLYNMKISSFSGIKLPNIKYYGENISLKELDEYIYRSLIHRFVILIFNRFCNPSNQRQNHDATNARVLTLYLLVPNVYSLQRTQTLLDNLKNDMITIVQKGKYKRTQQSEPEEFGKFIKGIEIIPVSESDASLVGASAVSPKHPFEAGNYLIMDAGKGTLDYSVTEFTNDRSFIRKNKGGIVGASAAISYGIFLDLVTEYARQYGLEINSSKIQSFVYSNVLGNTEDGKGFGGGDIYLLNRLMSALDRYKIAYGKLQVHKCEDYCNQNQNLRDVKLESFVDWIEHFSSKIELPYTDSIIYSIVNYAISMLHSQGMTNEKIDKVVFAGRGFLFSKFKEQMLFSLCSKFNHLEEWALSQRTDYTAVHPKTVCLFFPHHIEEGQYNPFQLPEPSHVSEDDLNDLKNNLDMSRTNDSATDNKTKHWWLNKATINPADRLPVCENNSKFSGGYTLLSCKASTYITIGGAFYQLPANMSSSSNATVFISNGVLFLRYKNKDSKSVVSSLCEISDLATGLAFPSLFPYCQITEKEDVYIPRLNVQQNRNHEFSHSSSLGSTSSVGNISSTETGEHNDLDRLKQLESDN